MKRMRGGKCGMCRHRARQRSLMAVALGLCWLLRVGGSGVVPQAVAQEESAQALALVLDAQEALTVSLVDQPGVVGIGKGK
jgi:hypothetical protein